MSSPTQVTITPPTTNSDGSPIATGEITGYTVGVRDTSASGSVAGTYPFSVTVPVGTTVEPLSLLAPALPTSKPLVAAGMTLSTNNGNSKWGAETASFTLVSPPNPPALGVS